MGADLLTSSLREGSFISPPPLKAVDGQARHARKLTPEDARIDPSWSAAQLRARDAVVGPLWDDSTWFALAGQRKRVQFAEWEDVTSRIPEGGLSGDGGAGMVLVPGMRMLVFKAADGAMMAPRSVKVEGSVFKPVERVVGRFI